MDTTATLLFETKEAHDEFFNLSEKQIIELQNDWLGLMKRIYAKIEKEKEENCNVITTACQRLDGKHYIVVMNIQFTNKEIEGILLKRFDNVDVDTYLDFLNEQKNENNKRDNP